MTAPCCQICGGKSDGQLICNACEIDGKPEYIKKTTVHERAAKYAETVYYIGGEINLAMRAAVMTAYVKGYRDRKGEEQPP
jgi:hypothetical protein